MSDRAIKAIAAMVWVVILSGVVGGVFYLRHSGIGQYHFAKAPVGMSNQYWDDYCVNIGDVMKTVENGGQNPGGWALDDSQGGLTIVDDSLHAPPAVRDAMHSLYLALVASYGGPVGPGNPLPVEDAFQAIPSCKP
jgi:hypothetical protein